MEVGHFILYLRNYFSYQWLVLVCQSLNLNLELPEFVFRLFVFLHVHLRELRQLGTLVCLQKMSVTGGIWKWTSLDFKWLKRGWVEPAVVVKRCKTAVFANSSSEKSCLDQGYHNIDCSELEINCHYSNSRALGDLWWLLSGFQILTDFNWSDFWSILYTISFIRV